jgi:hypothetical protein
VADRHSLTGPLLLRVPHFFLGAKSGGNAGLMESEET